MRVSVSATFQWQRLACVLLLGLVTAADAQLSLQLSLLDQPVTKPQTKRSAATGATSRLIALGEAVPARIELSNTGATPVPVMPSVNPAAGFLSFYLVTPEGLSNRLTAIRWETQDMLFKERPLAPGEGIVFETFLYGRLAKQGLQQDYLFDRPGRHEVLAEYAVEKLGVRVRSNRVTVNVGPPVAGWDQLKQAGIVELMEGRIRSRQEVSNRVARVESILQADKAHPLRSWVQSKSAAPGN